MKQHATQQSRKVCEPGETRFILCDITKLWDMSRGLPGGHVLAKAYGNHRLLVTLFCHFSSSTFHQAFLLHIAQNFSKHLDKIS